MRITAARGAAAALTLATAVALTACGSTDGTATRAAGGDSTTSTTDGAPSSAASTSAPDSSAPAGTAEVPREFAISGSASSKVTVTIIQDMACPACRQFHQTYEDTIEDIADHDPDVRVQYRVISFLDRASKDKYSSRAANAVYCAWSIGSAGRDADWIGDWTDYQEELFEKQPSEGGAGLSDARLVELADGDFPGLDACVAQNRFAAAVTANTDQQMKEPDFQGTPTVLINGKSHELKSPQDLKQAVENAKR